LGIPLPFTGEFEVVIMIEVAIEEMVGSNGVLDPQRLEASLRLVLANFNKSEMAPELGVQSAVCLKTS